MIAFVYSFQVQDELYIYSKSGERLSRLAEDFVGALSVSSKPDQSWFFATAVGFTTPGIVYHYDFKAQNQWNVYRTTQVNGLDPNDFIAEQVSHWFDSPYLHLYLETLNLTI
jgi:prolyl oligopeptidase